jgi:glycosyltransferase involved in cell wall biosynthesis
MNEINVLHLSTSDIDNGGARAAYRLHQGLCSLGCKSQMLVRAKFSSDASVLAEKSALTKLGPLLSELPLRFYSERSSAMFSPQWSPDVFSQRIQQYAPDIINIHWVCNGYLQIETLAKFRQPLVWTLHDMWPFTGGCHYNDSCENYKVSCGSCPQLHSDLSWDLSRWIWQRKLRAWQNIDLTIVATSSWMAECARSSSLFKKLRIEVIPLGLDTEKYKPVDKYFARDILNLPQTKKLILFGALDATTDPRKGSSLLFDALRKLRGTNWESQMELCVFGSSKPDKPNDLEFKVHYLGYLKDDIALALVYSAADVMIVPSLQEAFGQTASESLSCGTPVVAFNTTGLKDIIDHQKNGYLANPFEVDDLANGIVWILENETRCQELQENARQKSLKKFKSETQAQHYLSLYRDLLARSHSS